MCSSAQDLVPFIDLTSLNESDDAETISALCKKAQTPYGNVAAVCVYPQFVKQAAQDLQGCGIKIATVANFPQGKQSLNEVLQDIQASLGAGADEIDVVFPYSAYLNGEREQARAFVAACKKACGPYPLKVILETGAFPNPDLIAQAAADVILAGADFVKTSTGKISQGASLEAAQAILTTIRDLAQKFNRSLGFKVSGGIREPQQALEYCSLAQKILGEKWITPATFRIGASSLIDKF